MFFKESHWYYTHLLLVWKNSDAQKLNFDKDLAFVTYSLLEYIVFKYAAHA